MRQFSLSLALLCALTLGCGVAPSPQADSKSPLPATPARPASSIPLSVATWKKTEAMIAGHRGQVVVVDLWSTWCDPCLREFPGLVKLHNEHRGKVVCMSVNLNYSGAKGESPEDTRAEVLKFLTEQKADFQNILCGDADTDVYEALHLASVPTALVYDKSGKMRKRFDNESNEYGKEGFKYDPHIAHLVEMLLEE